MNIERAIGFDERLQELNFQRQKMDQEVIESAAQLKYQDYIMKNYQEMLYDKNMLRKEN